MQKRWLLAVLLIVALLAGSLGCATTKNASGTSVKNAPREIADDFVGNLFNGQFKRAYSLLSPRIREKMEEKDFVALARARYTPEGIMKSSRLKSKDEFVRRNPEFVKAIFKTVLAEASWRVKDAKIDKDKKHATVIVSLAVPDPDRMEPFEELQFVVALNRALEVYQSGNNMKAVENILKKAFNRVPKTTFDGVLNLMSDEGQWYIDKFSDDFQLKQSI